MMINQTPIPKETAVLEASKILKSKINKVYYDLLPILEDENKEDFLFFISIAKEITCRDFTLLNLYKNAIHTEGRTTQIEGIPDKDDKKAMQSFEIEIIKIVQNSFMSLMSALEYCMKNILHKHFKEIEDDFLGDRGKGRVYLSKILGKFNKLDFINTEYFNLWNGLIYYRNSIAHNNTYAEETKTYTFSESVSLKFNQSSPIKANIKQTIFLTEWMVFAYANLIIKILESKKSTTNY